MSSEINALSWCSNEDALLQSAYTYRLASGIISLMISESFQSKSGNTWCSSKSFCITYDLPAPIAPAVNTSHGRSIRMLCFTKNRMMESWIFSLRGVGRLCQLQSIVLLSDANSLAFSAAMASAKPGPSVGAANASLDDRSARKVFLAFRFHSASEQCTPKPCASCNDAKSYRSMDACARYSSAFMQYVQKYQF